MDIDWLRLLLVLLAILAVLAVTGVAAMRNPRVRDLLEAIEEAGWRRSLAALWALVTDRRVPWFVRVLPFPLLLYLVFPFDLIPDFIPVLGQADDVAIAAGALWVVVRFTPWEVLEEHLGQPLDDPAV